MHKLLFLIPVLLNFSCQENRDPIADKHLFNYTIDTVTVDPGEEILYLKGNLRWSALSSDNKYLFNFNLFDHTLEKINLEELRLEEKITFEKEGPDGTGTRFGQIQEIGRDSLYFSSQTEHAIFSTSGKKLVSYPVNNFPIGLEADEHIPIPVINKRQPHIIYGLAKDWLNKTTYFVKIDLKQQQFKRTTLPAFDVLQDYYFTMASPKVIMGPETFTLAVEDKVLLSNGVSNEIYAYDIVKDSLHTMTYQHTLTANRKKTKPPQEVAGREEFNATNRKLKEEINYLNPIWDAKNEIFYRFSYEENYQEAIVDGLPESKLKIYLTVYDRHLGLLSEHSIPELTKAPEIVFIKDGNIWIYQNMEDEMTFIRITIN